MDEYNAKPCKAGYICANGKCIQQFSLNNGNITDNKFACKSNFMYKGKCAEVVSVSQCIKGQVCSVKLTVSKESDTELKANDCDDNEDTNDCAYYQWYYDRLRAWKEYYEEFNKTIDEIKTDEELTSSRMRSESYFIYTYNKKKLNELDVMYYRKTRIADNEEGDCIKEYYMRQQSEYMIRISIVNVILFTECILNVVLEVILNVVLNVVLKAKAAIFFAAFSFCPDSAACVRSIFKTQLMKS